MQLPTSFGKRHFSPATSNGKIRGGIEAKEMTDAAAYPEKGRRHRISAHSLGWSWSCSCYPRIRRNWRAGKISAPCCRSTLDWGRCKDRGPAPAHRDLGRFKDKTKWETKGLKRHFVVKKKQTFSTDVHLTSLLTHFSTLEPVIISETATVCKFNTGVGFVIVAPYRQSSIAFSLHKR